MTNQPSWTTQSEYDIRCEWGLQGVAMLAPISDAIIIVDVLSFSTCVSIAVDNGAVVYPYAGDREELQLFADSVHAEVADLRDTDSRYSLSPSSLMNIPSGTRLVLPSPNGSTLSLHTGVTPTFVGCLRNAGAVAETAMRIGPRIAVIPAGEHWRSDGSLRPGIEDLLGAGAIINHLNGSVSPEALAALAVFHYATESFQEVLLSCSSGRELIARDHRDDVVLAAELHADRCAPILVDGAYRRENSPL